MPVKSADYTTGTLYINGEPFGTLAPGSEIRFEEVAKHEDHPGFTLETAREVNLSISTVKWNRYTLARLLGIEALILTETPARLVHLASRSKKPRTRKKNLARAYREAEKRERKKAKA